MKKILKNRKLIKIIIILIVVFILTPFLPYKCILNFGGLSYSGYEKLKIQNSSQDGLVLIEDCNELGLKSGKELDRYLLNSEEVSKELTIFKRGLSGYKFTLYGEFIIDEDGTRKFSIKEWNSVYVTINDTCIWEEKFQLIYIISVIPAVWILILLLMKLKKQKVKKNNLL